MGGRRSLRPSASGHLLVDVLVDALVEVLVGVLVDAVVDGLVDAPRRHGVLT